MCGIESENQFYVQCVEQLPSQPDIVNITNCLIGTVNTGEGQTMIYQGNTSLEASCLRERSNYNHAPCLLQIATPAIQQFLSQSVIEIYSFIRN